MTQSGAGMDIYEGQQHCTRVSSLASDDKHEDWGHALVAGDATDTHRGLNSRHPTQPHNSSCNVCDGHAPRPQLATHADAT